MIRTEKMSDDLFRVGIGWDVHPLAAPGPLKLGGVEIPFAYGLQGHSDADALVHAVCDALLGAAGLPDIGTLFPADNPEYKDIDSMILLGSVAGMIEEKCFSVNNIDSVVVAQEPRLAPYINSIKENLANALRIKPDRVGVRAKSPEGLGPEGRGEGISARCVASLIRKDDNKR